MPKGGRILPAPFFDHMPMGKARLERADVKKARLERADGFP